MIRCLNVYQYELRGEFEHVGVMRLETNDFIWDHNVLCVIVPLESGGRMILYNSFFPPNEDERRMMERSVLNSGIIVRDSLEFHEESMAFAREMMAANEASKG